MLMAERHRRILTRVRRKGVVSIREMVEELDVSEVTLRRDLRVLADEGLLQRTHGGAAYTRFFGEEWTHDEKVAHAAQEKEAIATAAAALTADGEVIALGAGSTTEILARRLTRRRNLTVITNSLLVARVLGPPAGITMVLTGGNLRVTTQALIGAVAEASLQQLHVSTLFISGNGFTLERGLSTAPLAAASVDQALARISDRVVVLADHTKIGHEKMVQTLPLDDIDHVVTDWQTPESVVRGLRKAGIEVTVAEQSSAVPHLDDRPGELDHDED